MDICATIVFKKTIWGIIVVVWIRIEFLSLQDKLDKK